jgi:hypothetical protein
MKTAKYLLPVLIFLFFILSSAFSQEAVQPMTARAYWLELNRIDYRLLKEKDIKGETLQSQEKEWLGQYERYLSEYFGGLSDEEKNLYYSEKDNWYLAAGYPELQNSDIIGKRRDPELLLKHIGFSGLSGLSYGLMLNNIFDYDEKVRFAVPTILAGGSMAIPIFSHAYDDINNNSLWLRSHGKLAGSLFGYSLGMTIFGDNIFDQTVTDETGTHIEEGRKREALSLALTSSLGLGYLGFNLGKNQDWSEGKASLFQYYGYAVPALTSAIIYATGENRLRAYGIDILLSMPAGYLLANQVSKLGDYTRGDLTAIIGLTCIGATYGAGFVVLAESDGDAAILGPALTAASTSFLGHCLFKDFHLTRPEGRRVNYAAVGGALIGTGIIALIEPENEGFNLILPATTGLIGYVVLTRYYKMNSHAGLARKEKDLPLFNFSLHPESLLFTRMNTHGYIPPLINASLQF